jgi:hypothetical protein
MAVKVSGLELCVPTPCSPKLSSIDMAVTDLSRRQFAIATAGTFSAVTSTGAGLSKIIRGVHRRNPNSPFQLQTRRARRSKSDSAYAPGRSVPPSPGRDRSSINPGRSPIDTVPRS